jgi:hypothetical protein
MAGKKSAASEAKAQKKNATYPAARADAQKRANATGFDHGLEWNDVFGSWNVFMLPARQNRRGFELRAEVVSPENIEKTQPGHGYGRASGFYNWDLAQQTASVLLRVAKTPGIRFGSLTPHGLIEERRVEKLMADGLLSTRKEDVAYLAGPMLDLTTKGQAFLDDYRDRKQKIAGRASGRTCAKKIRVQRKGYTRRDGTVVKPTTFTQCDPGLPGRRTRGSKAGPYKKQPKWVQKPGTLGGLGYAKRPERVRHQILRDAVEFYTYASTARKLHVILRSTTIHPDTRKVVERDVAWLRAQYRPKSTKA